MPVKWAHKEKQNFGGDQEWVATNHSQREYVPKTGQFREIKSWFNPVSSNEKYRDGWDAVFDKKPSMEDTKDGGLQQLSGSGRPEQEGK